MTAARQHAEWLQLIEVSGPFLSLPVLERVFPQGLPDPMDEAETVRALRQAHAEWQDEGERASPDPAIHQAWVRFVLRDVLGFAATPELLLEPQAAPPGLAVTVAEHHETLRPDLVVVDPASRGGKPRLLIAVVARDQGLEAPLEGNGAWKAGPAERMALLLRGTGVRLGLLTNGEAWLLVDAPPQETTGYATWYAEIWLDERLTLRAFRALLGIGRFFQSPDTETLEALLKNSAEAQQEVTTQLGAQVRRAVEVLVQAIDQVDRDRGRTLLAGIPEVTLYQSALTVMTMPPTPPPPCVPSCAKQPTATARMCWSATTMPGAGCWPPSEPSTAASPTKTCGCPPMAATSSTPTASPSWRDAHPARPGARPPRCRCRSATAPCYTCWKRCNNCR
jgi:hypothetical protein